jgi:acetyl-CoA carboxylase biotin carboxyl carrier protein
MGAARPGSGESNSMASKHPFDPDLVRELAKLISETDLTEIEVEKGDLKIRVARMITQVAAAMAPAPAPVIAPAAVHAAVSATSNTLVLAATPAGETVSHPGTVKSPMVGTAYRRASPEAKPFIEVGTPVKAGDKLLLIEAMKTFNDIVAPRAGVVTQILVDDKDPVEFGQPLVVIE